MKYFVFILFLILSIGGFSQEFYSENITSVDGLPNNAIRSIFKDSRGFIWIGTDAGVSKWDGNSFETYNSLDGLAGDKVWKIDEDPNGNMWFACFNGGISRFDGEKMISYTTKDGLVDNSVRIVKYSEKYDCLAIGTNHALSIFKDSCFYNFSTEMESFENEVIITGIMEDEEGIIFLDFKGKHYNIVFNKEIPEIKRYYIDPSNPYGISSVYCLPLKTYYGRGRDGILIKDHKALKEVSNTGQVFGITKDAYGTIWAASWNKGAFYHQGGLLKLDDLQAISMNQSYHINTLLGWSLYNDLKQNQMLYGTLDNSLYRIPPPFFEYYPPAFFNEKTFSVKSISIDNENRIWGLTDSLVFNLHDNKVQSASLKSFINSKLKQLRESSSDYQYNEILKKQERSIRERRILFDDINTDAFGDTWLSISNLGLFKFQNNDINHREYILDVGAESFAFNNENILYLTSSWNKTLIQINELDKPKSEAYSTENEDVFGKNIINNRNEIWTLGRISGIYLLINETIRNLSTEDSTINKIANDVCFDKENFAYIAGNDGRIELLEPVERKKVFDILIENKKHSVQWLKVIHNKLFAGYSDGLRVFSLESIKNFKPVFQFFQKSEGYQVKNIFESCLDTADNIWLATSNGLVKINTQYFNQLEYQPLQTYIESVEIFNQKVDWKQYGEIDQWSGLPINRPKLEPEQNNISIHYHTINFSNPEAEEYYYLLEGIDKDWVGPIKRNTVSYPYLNSGKYTFKVKSKNELSGLFSETAEFSFVILTPWYQQTWFYIFLLIIIIVSLFIIYKWRIHIIKDKDRKKREVMQKISELESKALQAQMNPHFLFNSLNSIQSFILSNNVDEALIYLNSFSRVIRMTLEFASKKFISLSDEIEYLKHYTSLENMRFDQLFTFTINIDPRIHTDLVMIPPMITQILVENAIKHGIMHLSKSGEIRFMVLNNDEESFLCVIEDNGIGRKASTEMKQKQGIWHESKGLKLVQDRLSSLNQEENESYKFHITDLYDDFGRPKGTRVEITIPYVI